MSKSNNVNILRSQYREFSSKKPLFKTKKISKLFKSEYLEISDVKKIDSKIPGEVPLFFHKNSRYIWEDVILKKYASRFFPKEFLGNIEITRHISSNRSYRNILNIKINTDRSSLLVGQNSNILKKYKNKMNRLLNWDDYYNLNICVVNAVNHHLDITLIGNRLAAYIEENLRGLKTRNYIAEIEAMPKRHANNILGIFIQLNGKLVSDIAGSEKIKRGQLNAQSLMSNVQQYNCVAQTKKGSIGVTIKINFDNKFTKNTFKINAGSK